MHLSKGTFHCLPDDYEINDPSLSDIRAALHPTYSQNDIEQIDSLSTLSRDLFGVKYLPGFVGLNNHHKTDCINAVVQALAHVAPIRDYFLARNHLDGNMEKDRTPSHKKKKNLTINRPAIQVTDAFSELVRKMWSKERFKSTVDPHTLVQSISVASKKRFQVGVQAEAGELIAWLLHQLHLGTGGGRKPGSSIIHKTFQGAVRVTTKEARKIQKETNGEEDDRLGSDEEKDENEEEDLKAKVVVEEKTMDTHFLYLNLNIRANPLFRDEEGGLVIPQEPLVNVLKKFDGQSFSDSTSPSGAPQRKRYRLLKLSDYLILHLDRFTSNKYSREKNPTIVAFPVKNLDLREYVFPEGEKPSLPSEEEVRKMSVRRFLSSSPVLLHWRRLTDPPRTLDRSKKLKTLSNVLDERICIRILLKRLIWWKRRSFSSPRSFLIY